MNKRTFGKSCAGWALCLSMLIALNAQADQPATDAVQSLSGGSATLGDFKIVCGLGLLPVVVDVERNLKGMIDVPLGKVSFNGKQARLLYCGYPVPGAVPSLVNTNERSVRGEATSTITGPKGLHLSCTNGELPFTLKGGAEGSLSTSNGFVKLYGDHNEVAVCLIPGE